jgi:hypothetical protein
VSTIDKFFENADFAIAYDLLDIRAREQARRHRDGDSHRRAVNDRSVRERYSRTS